MCFHFTKSGWYSDDPTVLSLNLLIRKISQHIWSSQEEAKVSELVEKVATKIQETFIPECSVNREIDGQDSTMIVFATRVESLEESLVQFDNEKAKVELIDPDDINNRVDVITDDNNECLLTHMQSLKPVVRCTFEILPDVSSSTAPRPISYHIAFSLGDEMLVYGGGDERGNVFSEDVWVFSLKTSSWKQHKTKKDLPRCVKGSTSWLNGNRMFLFGGWDADNEYSNDVHSLDLDTWEWTKHTTSGNKPSGRWCHALWQIANNAIIFGGYGKGGCSNDTFYLNTTTMKWTELSTTGTPWISGGYTHVQCAGKGFVFGGYSEGNYLNDLHMFDLTSHVWTKLQPTSGSLPPGRQACRMIARGTDLIIFGGDANINKVFSDCWAWDIEKKIWRELGEHVTDGRYSHTACYMDYDGSVLIFGGRDTNYHNVSSLGRVSLRD